MFCTLVTWQMGCVGPSTPSALLKSLTASLDILDAPPTSGPGAELLVETHLTVMSLSEVNMRNREVTLALFSRTIWTDPRLAWNSSHCIANTGSKDGMQNVAFRGAPDDPLKQRIWVPSMYVENWREPPKMIESGWRLAQSGRIDWTRKEFWKVACDMDFTLMPYDKQECYLRISSFMQDSTGVYLNKTAGKKAITVASDSVSGEVEWTIAVRSDEEARYRVNGFYNRVLDIYFTLDHVFDSYYRTTMVPIICFVALAYLSFWIQRNAVPARVGLVMVCYLALENKIGTVVAKLPPLPGDVWLIRFCNAGRIFVFIGLVEFAIANYLFRAEMRINKARAACEAEAKDVDAARADGVEPAAINVEVGPAAKRGRRRQLAQKIARLDRLTLRSDGQMWITDQGFDIAARYVYPVAYAITNVVLFHEAWGGFWQNQKR